jgi:hypothetical protein
MGPSTTQLTNLVTDPAFVDAVGRDFDLTPTSTAIDTGTPVAGVAFAGPAPDIGAFEAPAITGASLACDGSRVHLDVDTPFPPIVVPDCTGFTVHDQSTMVPLARCQGSSTGIELELAAPASGGSVLAVDYTGGGATDSFALGNAGSARVRPVSSLTVR